MSESMRDLLLTLLGSNADQAGASAAPHLCQQAQAALGAMLHQGTDLVLVTDLESHLLYASPSWEQVGLPPRSLVPGRLRDLAHQDDWAALETALAKLKDSRDPIQLEFRLSQTQTDSVSVWIEASAVLVSAEHLSSGVLILGRDVAPRKQALLALERSERRYRELCEEVTDAYVEEAKKLEAELHHARKLEAVGQLAAGIAHEINTPTQFVLDSVHFIREAYQDLRKLHSLSVLHVARGSHEAVREAECDAELDFLDEHVPRAFERCLDGLSRIASIVRSMKEFAHPDRQEKSLADLNHAIENTLTIARNEYKMVADVETQLDPLPPVRCHLGDLNQAFLNLIVNAAHAITDAVHERGGRGTLKVRSMRDGDFVRIEIEDSGCGIPESIRQRIFDPFFTTKKVGRGTGQGLAIARSIVEKRHGGTLTFRSEEGAGSTFVVRIPVSDSLRPE